MDNTKNPATGASGREIILRQIDLLELINNKLLEQLNKETPVNLAIYTMINQNIQTIQQLVNSLGPSF